MYLHAVYTYGINSIKYLISPEMTSEPKLYKQKHNQLVKTGLWEPWAGWNGSVVERKLSVTLNCCDENKQPNQPLSESIG